MPPSTIGGINLLPEAQKREIYSRLIPKELFERFHIPTVDTVRTQSLLQFKFAPGSTDVELSLYHEQHFPDPLLYGHMTDTMNGQIHILLYILNDPDAQRYNVDYLPDGTSTQFGTSRRNLEAEQAAMEAGLAPGQVRRGLRLLPMAVATFEKFIASLGQELFFAEPLYYHNAVLFERYGFTYQKGRKLMERIESGFAEGGDLNKLLDDSTPFRSPKAATSIRRRSWAIHDGLLGEHFTDVTMYKRVGQSAGLTTCPSCTW